jgi:hypothetical protein
VGQATLVDLDIAAGAKLVKSLDRHDFPLSAAFWIYSSDTDEWDLIVASPLVDEHGPHWAYQELRDASGTKPPIPLSRISLVPDDHPLVTLLRSAVNVRDHGIRITNNSIDGVLIDDAYIYRMAPPEAWTPPKRTATRRAARP